MTRKFLDERSQKLVAEDLEILEMENRIDLEDIKKALSETKKNGTIPWEQVKQKLDLR